VEDKEEFFYHGDLKSLKRLLKSPEEGDSRFEGLGTLGLGARGKRGKNNI
jgi:hypothetical protein